MCVGPRAQVGPEFDADTIPGFWPSEDRIDELEAEVLDFQFEAHWLSGATFEASVVWSGSESSGCSVAVNVSGGDCVVTEDWSDGVVFPHCLVGVG
jgi:hypothetical protein